jgi:CheY-like chemotaxis protein
LDLIITDSRSLVRADPLLLDQLLGNLVSNAVRHTVTGRIEVSATELIDNVRISVKDTGIGIPEEHLEDIFVEFFQVGNQERDRRKGLGLGLAIVKRLSDLLGYDVGVKSTLGEGSEFHITVPLAQYVAEASPPRADTATSTASDELQCIVAVVDDEPEVREALEFLLNQWGCLTITAASGHALLEALDGEDVLPDVLVTDYRLAGGETGTQLISRMSERAGGPLPAIMITGDTAPNRLREWQAKGLTVLHKPVSPDRLRQALLLALNRKAT